MRAIYFAGVICMFLFILASAALAKEEFVFQFGKDGYDKTRDSHVTEYTGNNTNNMGGNLENECCEYDPANTDGKSMLLWFDVSSIPRSAVLEKATLELYMTSTRNGTGKKSVAAHQLLKDWAEGDGVGIDGNGATQDEVCGKWTGKGEAWDKVGADSPGKDWVEKANDTIEIEGGIGKWYIWKVTEMCQNWIRNPEKNFGVILLEPRPHAPTLGTKVFAAKENADAKIHPILRVMVSAMSVEPGEKLTSSWGRVKSGI